VSVVPCLVAEFACVDDLVKLHRSSRRDSFPPTSPAKVSGSTHLTDGELQSFPKSGIPLHYVGSSFIDDPNWSEALTSPTLEQKLQNDELNEIFIRLNRREATRFALSSRHLYLLFRKEINFLRLFARVFDPSLLSL
jgi:hypothetical protein